MAPYASPEDVRLALGTMGSRLPVTVDVEAHLGMAHAEVLDRLADSYAPDAVPTFTGDGAETVRWAEAKLAAAAILDILRAYSPGDSPVAENLRTSAYDTLTRGVPGFRPGTTTGGSGTTSTPLPARPMVSNIATVTVFADPYSLAPNVWDARRSPFSPGLLPPALAGLIPLPITQAAYDLLAMAGADDPRYLYVIVEPADLPA